MTRKKKEEHWAFAVLREKLSEEIQVVITNSDAYPDGKSRIIKRTKTPDWELETIFLFEPELKREISNFFYETLYPQILTVFENELFQIPAIDKIELSEIRDPMASCNALFIITDSKRPISSDESPWWYIRFNLRVTSHSYFLNTELMLLLPFWLESDWALDFMVDARNWAIPPTLSTDRNELILNFSWGHGRNYIHSEEERTQHFVEPFKKHLLIAKAIDRFSENPANRFLKSHMLQVIREMYEG